MIIDDFKLWLKSNEERILQQGLRLVDVYKNITEKEIEKYVLFQLSNIIKTYFRGKKNAPFLARREE